MDRVDVHSTSSMPSYSCVWTMHRARSWRLSEYMVCKEPDLMLRYHKHNSWCSQAFPKLSSRKSSCLSLWTQNHNTLRLPESPPEYRLQYLAQYFGARTWEPSSKLTGDAGRPRAALLLHGAEVQSLLSVPRDLLLPLSWTGFSSWFLGCLPRLKNSHSANLFPASRGL